MCRILFLAIEMNDKSKSILDILINSFIRASEYDYYFEQYTKGARIRHDDGWGIAVGAIYRDYLALFHEKSALPVFHDVSKTILYTMINKVKDFEKAYVILHSRAASRTEPLGSENAHPFREDYSLGILWLVHNGGINKKKIAKDIGIYPWIYIDSAVLTKYIAKKIDSCVKNCSDIPNCVSEIYREVYDKYLDRCLALVTGLLISCRDSVELYASTPLKDSHTCSELKRKYYQVYMLEQDSISAMMSSTIRDFLISKVDIGVVDAGSVLVKIDIGKITKLLKFE